MRWEAFGARLKTHRGFGPCVWVLLPFGGICVRYDDYRDTDIKILTNIEIHMRYKPLRLVWVHTEVLGRVLRRLVLWGSVYACIDMMRYMRYEIAFPCLTVVASGHGGFLIARPFRFRYDEIILLGTCLVTDFRIQFLSNGFITFLILCDIIYYVYVSVWFIIKKVYLSLLMLFW